MDLIFFENLLQWSAQQISASESESAKINYFKDYGKVFAEDSYFDSRMQYFDCVRIFETKYESLRNITLFEAWRLAFSKSPIISFLHSCFLVKKVTDSGISVVDVWSQESLEINALKNQNLKIFKSGDLIQSFLLYINDDIYLAPGTMQHPREISKLVLKKIKSISNSSTDAKIDFLQKLSMINLKHLRQKNLAPKQIYDMGLSYLTNPAQMNT